MRTRALPSPVSAYVEGDFDKKGLPRPFLLAFYFSLSGAKVSASSS